MAYTDMALMDVTPHAIAIGALGGLTGQTQTQIILVPAPATCAALIAHVHVVNHVHRVQVYKLATRIAATGGAGLIVRAKYT